MISTRFFLCAVLVFPAATLFAQDVIINDRNAESRVIPAFSSINVSDGIRVYLSQSNDHALAVSYPGSPSAVPIRTEVKDGVLHISLSERGRDWRKVRRPRVYVAFVQVHSIAASGGSDVSISGKLIAPALRVDLSGASDLTGEMEARKLVLHQSGASDALLSGRVDSLDANLSGASHLKGGKLEVERCITKASGASDVYLTINKELSVEVSGASSVNYTGPGVILESQSGGASRIRRRS